MNQLERLKSILQKELEDLKSNLMKNHSQQGDATDRLLSRLADRNDIIRINTDADHVIACAGFPFYGIAWTKKGWGGISGMVRCRATHP